MTRRREPGPWRSLLASVALLAAMPAQASVGCSFSTVGVNFGVYDMLRTAASDSTGSVTVSCANAPPPGNATIDYAVTLSSGSSGNFASRRMASGRFQLQYNLFMNSARTQVWGDGSAGSGLVGGSLRLAGRRTLSDTYPIYGRIPAQQDVGTGSYADTIVVTLVF